jgi:hypothetical protein
MGVRWTLCAGLAAATVVAGCVSPALDNYGYRAKVTHSADSMTGIVGTARLAAELDLNGKLSTAVRDTVVSDAENDAQSVLTSLDTVQPPDEAMIALKDKADKVLQQAADDVSSLRVAQRSGNRHATQMAVSALSHVLDSLHKLQELK